MSVSPVALRNLYGDLFGTSQLPVLEELFRTEYSLAEMVHPMLFKQVAHDRDIWQGTEMHDLQSFDQIPEGSEYTFVRQKQGASKTLTMAKYGLGVSISEEMVSDGKFDHIADLIKELGRSAAESREVRALQIFNNGFATELTADGRPVFDTAHTLPSGGTFRNELSSPADLDVTSLETALTDFSTQFVSDNGKYFNLRPKVLLVHSSNFRNAKELIGSELKTNNVTSGNDNGPTNRYNSFKEEGLMVVQSPRLTDTDAWFLLSEPSETGLRVINRWPVETKAAMADTVGFSTDAILYKSRYRWQVGVTHPYGVFGSPGA